MTTTIPALPVERLETEPVYLNDYNVWARRHAQQNEKADFIALSSCKGDSDISAHSSFHLSPSLLVHLANELLTDNERAQIEGSSRDLIQMEIERSNDAYEQVNDANEAYNSLLTQMRDAGMACAHLFGLKLMHVLVHDGGKQWRKATKFLCAGCREHVSALAGSHNFTAPMLPDLDFPEWRHEPLAIAGGATE